MSSRSVLTPLEGQSVPSHTVVLTLFQCEVVLTLVVGILQLHVRNVGTSSDCNAQAGSVTLTTVSSGVMNTKRYVQTTLTNPAVLTAGGVSRAHSYSLHADNGE